LAMELRHLGYACINLSLDLTTNRTFRLARLSDELAAQTTAQNLQNLEKILAWNLGQGIRLFRVGSSVVPFASHAQFTLDWVSRFEKEIAAIRDFVQANGMRLSMHPGQYTVLNALNEKVVGDALREIEWQAELISQLDPAQGGLVIHVGGAYGDKAAAIQRFETNFYRLSPNAQKRLTLENDDTTFAAGEVLDLCQRLNVPMIFDIFHHKCLHSGPDWQAGLPDLLEKVVETWQGRVPKLHISSQKAGTRTSHADYITQEDFDELLHWMRTIRPDGKYDLMVEAKMKEQATQALLCGILPLQRKRSGG
jgi:UV DNA damage endonuclease